MDARDATSSPSSTGTPYRRRWEPHRGRVRPAALLVGVVTGIGLLLAVQAGVSASVRTDVFHVTVRGSVDGADGALPAVTLDGLTFAQASATIDMIVEDAATAGETAHAQLIAAPKGIMDLELLDAVVERTDLAALPDPDPGVRAMSVRGMLTQSDPDNVPIEVLVTAHWPTATSATPTTAIFFRWDDAVLSEFVPLENQEVELLGTWLAIRRPTGATDTTPATIPADLTPSTAEYLSDGRDSTVDDVAVLPTNFTNLSGAVAFRGILDHEGALAHTMSQIGLSNSLRLDGQISISKVDRFICPGFDANNTEQTCKLGKAPRQLTAVGVDVTASIPVAAADTGRLPDNVEQGADWAIRIAANTAQQVEFDLSGSVIAWIGETPLHLRGSLALTHDKVNGVEQVAFGLAGLEIDNAFGVEWLDFESAGGQVSYTSISTTKKKKNPGVTQPNTSTTVLELGFFATMKLGSIDPDFGDETATATFSIEHGSGGFNAEMSVSTDAVMSLNRLLALADVPESEVFDVGLHGLGVAVKLTPTDLEADVCVHRDPSNPSACTWTPRTKTKATVAINGTAFVGWGEVDGAGTRATISTDVFTRFVVDENGVLDGYFVDVRGSQDVTTTVGRIIGVDLGDLDVELPSFGVSASDRTWSVPAVSLDPVTLAWTGGRGLGCGGVSTLLCIRDGVRLNASVDVTGPLAVALKELGPVIDPDTPLVISGTLPLLNSTSFGLAIQLPTFETPADVPGPFRGGTLSLAFGQRIPEGQTKSEIYLELTGNATVRIATPGVEYASGGTTLTCPEVDDGLVDYPLECQDDLTFTVIAGFTSSTASGVSISVRGDLATADGWHEPFGVPGLTIQSLRLEVGVSTGGTSTPGVNVTIGMEGSINVKDDTYVLAFELAVTPTPPYVKPLGFTFAASSFGLEHLVELYETVSGEDVDTSNLPGLWFEDIHVAFGLQDNPALCIRQGFLLTAELHFDKDGMPDGPLGNVPACNGLGNLPPADFSGLPQSCGDDDTCLAAILIDVQFGTTITSALNSRLVAKGYFAATEFGPLKLDAARIELELSAAEQHFHISGGTSLYNPFCYRTPSACDPLIWADGDFLLDITLQRMELSGDIRFFDNGLEAGIWALADLNFENPTFQVETYLRAPALEALADDIAQGFEDLGTTVESLGPLFDEAATTAANDLAGLVERVGKELETLTNNALDAVAVELLKAVDGAQAFVRDVNKQLTNLGLEPVDFSPIFDIALHGFEVELFERIPGFREPFTGGCILFEREGECWLTYDGLSISFPGLCDAPGNTGSPLCSMGTSNQQAVQAFIADQFKSIVESPSSLAATSGFGAQSVSAASTEAQLSIDELGVTAEEALERLNEEFSGDGVVATCATTTIDYDNGTLSPTAIHLEANGAATELEFPLELAGSDVDPDGQLFQQSVKSIVDENAPAAACDVADANLPVEPLTINFAGSSSLSPTVTGIDEGSTAWAFGEGPAGETLNITWGDGATSSPTVLSDGTWSSSHTYLENGSVSVGVSADDEATSRRLLVRNVAPTAVVSSSPTNVREGEEVTLHITTSDVGVLDLTFLDIHWGDGTITSHAVPGAGGGTIDITHTYVDEGSTGKAANNVVVQVVVRDDDGSTSTSTATVRVVNVAPSLLFELVSEPVEYVNGVPVFEEDQETTWRVTVDDPGALDLLRLDVYWRHPLFDLQRLHVDPPSLGSTQRVIELTHTWSDDVPLGTPEDTFLVHLFVFDEDTGFTQLPAPVEVIIRNVNPTLQVTGSAEVNESEEVTLTVDTADVGSLDAHEVTVDWKDGTIDTVPVPGTGGGTVDVSHTYADDNPTATPQDLYQVEVIVTDDDTGTASATHDLTVYNVAPTIESLTLDKVEQSENERVVTLEISFLDVSPADSHTVRIDWGDGWRDGESADTVVEDEDARETIIEVAADDPRAITATNRYGDDGVYTITVTVTDDDTGHDVDDVTLVVTNVDPTATLDRSLTTATAGGDTFLLDAGRELVLRDTGTDVGSDDLEFSWNLGDGTDVTAWWRSAGQMFATALIDPDPSPQVQPSHATHEVAHTWTDVCLYGVTVDVADDDDGSAATEHVAVIAQGTSNAGSRNGAEWRAPIHDGLVSQERLDCLLEIAGHLSPVFVGRSELDGGGGSDPTPWSPRNGIIDITTRDGKGAPVVLTATPDRKASKLAQEQVKLDEVLLALWLSWADGAYEWDAGLPDGSTFHETMARLEDVRLESRNVKEVNAAWRDANALVEYGRVF